MSKSAKTLWIVVYLILGDSLTFRQVNADVVLEFFRLLQAIRIQIVTRLRCLPRAARLGTDRKAD
jgi:hypothetical protein